jgi:small subunit ribosomal protein S20
MANTASAAKQARVALRRRAINRVQIKAVRASEKKIRSLATAGKKDEALKLYPEFQSVIDRAAKKGVIKKNTASRHKERVAAVLKSPSVAAPAAA